MTLRFDLPARVHLSLLDMSGKGYRRHGGLGFSISGGYECFAALADTFSIQDRRRGSRSNAEQVKKLSLFAQCIISGNKLLKPVSFVISSGFDAHQGFGSGTTLTLAILESIFNLSGIYISEQDLVTLSLRGGVSGVGTSTYFRGGFLLDLGVPNQFTQDFKSSDEYAEVKSAPLKLVTAEFPAWRIGVCIPPSDRFVTEQEERNFFRALKPVDENLVHLLVYEAIFGATASVLEKNFKGFCISVGHIQECYWKLAERLLHKEFLADVEDSLRSRGAISVAMSSLGPGSIFFVDSAASEFDGSDLPHGFTAEFFLPDNSGRKIYHA